MAVMQTQNSLHIHKLPLSKYVDGLRWLPPLSAFDKFVVFSLFDSDSCSSSIEIHSLTATGNDHSISPSLSSASSFPSLSRTTSLRVSQSPYKILIAFSTFAGSLNLLFPVYSGDFTLETQLSVRDSSFHSGPISDIDVLENECVSVGEDGRVNLTSLCDSRLSYRRVFDSNGLVSYTAAKWASPMEFATGGLGFSLQWWDQRKPGEPALRFKGNWPQKTTHGIVHSIDIHPSRKHICLAGGSSGTVFAWDLRWQQQPIILSGVGIGERPTRSPSESDVWEVQYDCHLQSSNISSISSPRMLPVMMCAEDGILAVVGQGLEPVELLAESCAINNFDIDKQNNSHVICSLEWEAVAVLTRPSSAKLIPASMDGGLEPNSSTKSMLSYIFPLYCDHSPNFPELQFFGHARSGARNRLDRRSKQRQMMAAALATPILSSNLIRFRIHSSNLILPSIRKSYSNAVNLTPLFTERSNNYSLNLNYSHSIASAAGLWPVVLQKRASAIAVSSPFHPSLGVFCAKGYKMKTHKASAKRFRVTGRGKIMRRRAGKQHLLAKKNSKRKLRLSKMVQVHKSDYDNVIGALPYLKVNRQV
ncbi:hypothetical protein Nepgr_015626 [Nepenthes gracilis]|uniref:50S ribosomal protein L35 n=1 Tax=Nepenthes gracilis TaxID=150966 RepID=A0AAD3XRR2_NEPGR|nr:hypothetical protein Nepgr_015626 [Nepenthes gracilis]